MPLTVHQLVLSEAVSMSPSVLTFRPVSLLLRDGGAWMQEGRQVVGPESHWSPQPQCRQKHLHFTTHTHTHTNKQNAHPPFQQKTQNAAALCVLWPSSLT